MINKWWRNNNIAAVLVVLARLYVGVYFLKAGWGKITSGKFDASGFLTNAVTNPVKGPDGNVVYGAYVGFLEKFALPNVDLFNTIVPIGELLIGLGLILGCFTLAAAFFQLLMNFSFVMAGAISSNPLDIFLGFLIITAGANAGKYGLDYYVLPYVRKLTNKGKESRTSTAA